MSASDDYCELCDLPKSQCVHGMPPPPPPTPREAPKPRRRSTTPKPKAVTTSRKPVTRKWTPPDALKPLIVSVLQEAGGQLEADELFKELEARAGDELLAGDREPMPGGELRWHNAARRARVALINEGLMKKAGPGIWQLA